LKARGGVLGVILAVALLGYVVLSGQLSPGQLIEELLGGGGSAGMPAASLELFLVSTTRKRSSRGWVFLDSRVLNDPAVCTLL
jgi:hypothetical protein